MSQSSVQNVTQLLSIAAEEGDISKATMVQLVDAGAEIQAALGVGVDDVKASEVVLFSQLLDDSGSIRFAGNADLVRWGSNLSIEALRESKQVSGILAMTRYLNGHVLYPYGQLSSAVLLTPQNYDPNQGTPLYDASLEFLGSVLVKTKEFSQYGVPVRSISWLVSDGADEHSPRSRGGKGTTAADVRELVQKMLATEQHIIGALGLQTDYVDFREIFKEMGIPEEWILVAERGQNEQEFKHNIRKQFQVMSQSAVRASKNAASFSQTAMGGFGGN